MVRFFKPLAKVSKITDIYFVHLSLAQANLCEILTVSIESVIDSWESISGQLFKQRLKRSCFMVLLESSGAKKGNALDATTGVQ